MRHLVRSSSERGEGDRTTYRVELVELVVERMMRGVCLLEGLEGLPCETLVSVS